MDDEGRWYFGFEVTTEASSRHPETPKKTVYYYQRARDVEPEHRREYLHLLHGHILHGATAIALAERLEALYERAGCWRFDNAADVEAFLGGRGLRPGSRRSVWHTFYLVVPRRSHADFFDHDTLS